MINRSGKSRVLASSAVIKVMDATLGKEREVGEIDSFTATSTTELAKSRPIGSSQQNAYAKYGGYELTMKGGKVDWQLANLIHMQDSMILLLSQSPTFSIYQTITYYDGTQETYIYLGCVIYGYSLNAESGAEVKEDFKAFSTERHKVDGDAILDIVHQIQSQILVQAFERLKTLALDQLLGLG